MALPKLTRREFLQVGAAAGAAATSPATASSGVLGANDRIHFGIIGVGNQGTNHLRSLIKRSDEDNIRCLAVSDVYQKRINRAVGILGGGHGYIDYRRLLDIKEIDAILIATPDHWHAKLAIDSMEAGKHVYLEKPMTLWSRLDDAMAVRDTVKRLGKVLQVGPQATSDPGVWEAQNVLKAARIGKVTWAQASYNRNGRKSDYDTPPFVIDPAAGPTATGENYIDWDMWLGWKWGLAPKTPYNPMHFFRFRKFWAYSGGLATDLLYHKLAPILLAIAGPDGEYPVRATAVGGKYYDFKYDHDGGEVPDTYLTTIDFPSEYSVCLVSTVTNDTQVQDRIYGKHGTLVNFEGDPGLSFNGPFAPEFERANDGYAAVEMAGKAGRDMEGNFIDVIRGKGRLYCNADLGATTMVGIGLGVEAYRRNRTMLWDAKAEKGVEG